MRCLSSHVPRIGAPNSLWPIWIPASHALMCKRFVHLVPSTHLSCMCMSIPSGFGTAHPISLCANLRGSVHLCIGFPPTSPSFTCAWQVLTIGSEGSIPVLSDNPLSIGVQQTSHGANSALTLQSIQLQWDTALVHIAYT